MSKMDKLNGREGFAMLMALLMIFIASSFAALLYRQSMQAMHAVKLHKANDEAQLAAQSALGQMRKGIADKFMEYYFTKNRHFHQLDNWFNTHNGKKIGTAGVFYEFPETITISSYPEADIVLDFSSTDFNKNTKGMAFADLTFTAQARMSGATRAVRERSRCEFKQSSVFDYAYFLNNFGWFYDVNMIVNGDIRSNQETELASSSLVLNGNSFSAGTTHLIEQYQQWNSATYESRVSAFARPLENPFSNTTTTWDRGYNLSTTKVVDKQDEVPMPYLGNTDGYIEYAEHNHGTVKQGNKTLVDAYYNGPGFNENSKVSADDGTLVLIGTLNNPIEINGPVVVENDLIIKGYIKGQGSFYVGRNVHVIDDLKYVNPPRWVKPLHNIDTAVKDTAGSDFVGLCAKGSVILGDYNSRSFKMCKDYMKPPFTSAYATDESDTDIGYCNTRTSSGEKAFTGDYTANYGVKPHANSAKAARGKTVGRPYYSSSLSDNDFASLKPAQKITQLDAMVYNNHIMAGYFNRNAIINGGLVCRDEAMMLSGKLELNWDTRLNGDPRLPGKPYGQGLGNSFEPFLPIGGPAFHYEGWSEVAPTLAFAGNSSNGNSSKKNKK